jgi:glycosyltransferase involved in cell wall biosynthesis
MLLTYPLFWIALFAFLMTLVISYDVFQGLTSMKRLADVTSLKKEDAPRVTIIVPACNEAATIRPALFSLLNQDYHNLEIIVVNDRSTDRTGDVLRDLKLKRNNFREYCITDLPEGWLGKSHALHYGAQLATGDYLLFTDADIIMEKTTLSRAMQYVLDNNLDHLSLLFKSIAGGGLLNSMILDAGGALLFLFKPWKARTENSRYFMGVGAFNLVRASAYHETGGHESIRMHPIDDIMLGKILKEHGYRQDCLLGQEHVTVRWYASTQEMIDGLMKNVFSLFHFNAAKAFMACLISFLLHIFPFWALFFTRGTTQILFVLTVFIRFASFASGFRTINLSAWNFPWALVTPYINIYIVLKATATTLINEGISWRGTRYPLALLRQNKPIL